MKSHAALSKKRLVAFIDSLPSSAKAKTNNNNFQYPLNHNNNLLTFENKLKL